MKKFLTKVKLTGGSIATIDVTGDIKELDKIVICYNGEFIPVYASPAARQSRIVGKLDMAASKSPYFFLTLGAIAIDEYKSKTLYQQILLRAAKQAGYRRTIKDYVTLMKYIAKRLIRTQERIEKLNCVL